MSANAPQTPQQAGITFEQFVQTRVPDWANLNADQRRGIASIAYKYEGVKTVGDAAQQFDEQNFVNKASQINLAPQAPNTNFLGDLGSHFLNAATGYQNDALLQQSGQGVGAFLGDLGGGLVPVGTGALGGAGLGALSATPFGVAAGAIGGGIAGAGGAGVAQDLQNQRLSGKYQSPDWGRALGAGAIQGGLQAIPGVNVGGKIVKPIINAGIQGVGGALGDIGQQAFEQHSLLPNVDWNRTASASALGAAGGAIGSFTDGAKPETTNKRYFQGVRKLTETVNGMIQQAQAAPIGLRGINAMPDANLATFAIIPEGQGAGAYAGDLPPQDMSPMQGSVVEDQNTQNLRRLADMAIQRAAGGDYKPVQKAQEYIANVKQAGGSIPDEIEQKINQAIEGDPQKLDEIASKVYYMGKRGQGNEAVARYVAPLPRVQKGRVVDRIDALAKVEKDYEASIKAQERARIGKKREESAYAKLQEDQLKAEKKQKERLASFELSRDTSELGAIAHALADERKAAGKNQAAVDLKKAAETEGLTTKDQAYIKDQITQIEAANRKAEARAYRATSKETPVPKNADKQLLALAKDDATQYASLMVDANGDKPAIDLLEQLGYKVDLADDGYGHKKSRRVFLGGRAGTVKFEVGDSLKAFGAKVSANGGTLQTYIASKMVKLSQETGAPVHRIAGETLGDAIEAIDNDIIAGESQAAVDALTDNAEIDAGFEVAARDEAAGAYYEEVDAAYNAIKDRFLAVKTPEEAHAAFDYMEQRLEPLQTKEQEMLIKGLDEEYTHVAKVARKQIEMEQAIDAAIDKKELVTLHGTAFEQVGDTLNYNEGGIKGGTNKSLGKRTQETVVDKGVKTDFINNKPESFLYIRTIDNQGQLRTRYVYNSPKGSKIDSIELSGEPSPYRYERVEIEGRMTDIVVGPNGVVPQKQANASMETSELEKTIDLLKYAAANSESLTVDDIQRIGAGVAASGIDRRYVEGAIENMSDEGRRAAFKDMTGGDC